MSILTEVRSFRTHVHVLSILSVLAVAGCSNAAAQSVPEEPIARRLRDEDALRTLAYCYGRGLDEISIHYANRPEGKRRATALYERCFEPNVTIEVYALGADKPLRTTATIGEWVDFADGFFADNRYSSTRHLMSNFSVEMKGIDAATVTSYASIPHFLRSDTARDAASAAPTVEYMIARYVDEAARKPDGTWRTVRKTVYLEEIWRGTGFFPGGQGAGR